MDPHVSLQSAGEKVKSEQMGPAGKIVKKAVASLTASRAAAECPPCEMTASPTKDHRGNCIA